MSPLIPTHLLADTSSAAAAAAAGAGELQLPPGLNDNIYTIAGPFLYGGAASMLLLGALIVLIFFYFARSSKDRWQYKVAITLLLCASLAAAGATLYLQNFLFLAGFGDPTALHAWPVAIFVLLATPTFSAVCSQALFGHRLWNLAGRSKLVGGALIVVVVVNVASGLSAIVTESMGGGPVPLNGNDLLLFIPIDPTARSHFWRTIIVNEIFLGISAITDLLLTLALTYLLLTRRKKSAELSSDTNKMIWRVVYLSVATGAITSFFSIGVAVIILATVHHNNISFGMTLQLTHVYAIVCVSSLNLRRSMSPGHKGSSGNLSRSQVGAGTGNIATVTLEKTRTRSEWGSPISEKLPYAFPPAPHRSLSQGSRDFSRPSTGKSMDAPAQRPGTGKSNDGSHRPTLSNSITVHSHVVQRVEGSPSEDPSTHAVPMLSYFHPRPARSHSLRSAQTPQDLDAQKGNGRPSTAPTRDPLPPSFRGAPGPNPSSGGYRRGNAF